MAKLIDFIAAKEKRTSEVVVDADEKAWEEFGATAEEYYKKCNEEAKRYHEECIKNGIKTGLEDLDQ